MHKRSQSSESPASTVFWLLIKLLIYAAFVTAYYFSVLHFLGGWLKQMFDAHKTIYALIVLPLIIAQAVLLNSVVMALRKWGGGKTG